MATFAVTNVNDSGVGSLREAIDKANSTTGADTIAFAIPGSGVQRIGPLSELPAITDSVTIDGTSQGSSTSPLIVIDGTLAGSTASGLRLSRGSSTLRGLAVNKFSQNGIVLESDSNIVEGSFIGLNPNGLRAAPNLLDGIQITGSGNIVGGTTSATTNVISGNGKNGVSITGLTAQRNQVIGNVIGLDQSKTSSVPNLNSGVRIGSGASSNLIGGTLTTQRNFISGNKAFGVLIEGAGSDNNVLHGNFIGNGAEATPSVGNDVGVAVRDGARFNSIGSSETGARNVIAGNFGSGVQLRGLGTNNNQVAGNAIGVLGVGVVKLANGEDGVLVDGGAFNNTIGGTTNAFRNIISANTKSGITISGVGTGGTRVLSNLIGLDSLGTSALPNLQAGVSIVAGASGNSIGEPLAGNTISGNQSSGISLSGVGTNNNLIRGNRIGTTSDGSSGQGNLDGINVAAGATNNIIGGIGSNDRNIINGNLRDGILLTDATTTGNQIQGNEIGSTGFNAVNNTRHGISVLAGANNNTIGSALASNISRNSITGNGGAGIFLSDLGSSATIVNNLIGLTKSSSPVANAASGISITDGATAAIGGVNTNEGNFISGNFTAGVLVTGNRTSNVAILGNFVGLNQSGLGSGNKEDGIRVTGSNVVIGSGGAGRNVISANASEGIELNGANNVTVQGNLIGTSTSGLLQRGNGRGMRVSNSTNVVIGGSAELNRNVISGNLFEGMLLANTGATVTDPNIRIENNLIGLAANGTSTLPNKDGVEFFGAIRPVTLKNNFVSGNTRMGIVVANSSNQIIASNKIGVKADGVTPAGNGSHGVLVSNGSTKNRIGGFGTADGNLIANNGGDGILVGSDPGAVFTGVAGTGNSLLHNLIFSNAGQSIDLGNNDGVTANDVDDLDTGANNMQNAPVLTSAVTGGGLIQVQGKLDSLPGKYRIDFYVGSAPGQAERFLGTLIRLLNTVDLEFILTQQANVSVGSFVMAMVTNEDTGDSSELSAAVQIG